MNTRTLILHRIALIAPWLTLAMLVVLPLVLPNRAPEPAETAFRQQEVAAVIENVPYFLDGGWVGADDQVPPEAQKLLRPNATLSRKYRRIGSPPVHVFLVHCGDSRDMIGHYPPICYPSAGWLPVVGAEKLTSLTINGRDIAVREYGYRQMREQGEEMVIRIFNAFILPDGTVTPEIDDINRESERVAVAVQGVAQLQVITPASMDREAARAAASELLTGMGTLFDVLGVNQDEGDGRVASR